MLRIGFKLVCISVLCLSCSAIRLPHSTYEIAEKPVAIPVARSNKPTDVTKTYTTDTDTNAFYVEAGYSTALYVGGDTVETSIIGIDLDPSTSSTFQSGFVELGWSGVTGLLNYGVAVFGQFGQFEFTNDLNTNFENRDFYGAGLKLRGGVTQQYRRTNWHILNLQFAAARDFGEYVDYRDFWYNILPEKEREYIVPAYSMASTTTLFTQFDFMTHKTVNIRYATGLSFRQYWRGIDLYLYDPVVAFGELTVCYKRFALSAKGVSYIIPISATTMSGSISFRASF